MDAVAMDERFHRALFAIAGEMQVLAFEVGIDRIYEADLRSATRRALQLRSATPVVPEAPLKLKEWNVGAADIAVLKKGTGFEALAELKVWRKPDKINEALWDAWKLASAYTENLAPCVYLIALGPSACWRSGNPLIGFWDNCTWNSRELWQKFSSVMAPWVSEKKGPSKLPAGMKTTPIGSAVPVQLFENEPWLLRCSRITTTTGRAFTVPLSEVSAQRRVTNAEEKEEGCDPGTDEHSTGSG
jgi:hypothetical protein